MRSWFSAKLRSCASLRASEDCEALAFNNPSKCRCLASPRIAFLVAADTAFLNSAVALTTFSKSDCCFLASGFEYLALPFNDKFSIEDVNPPAPPAVTLHIETPASFRERIIAISLKNASFSEEHSIISTMIFSCPCLATIFLCHLFLPAAFRSYARLPQPFPT